MSLPIYVFCGMVAVIVAAWAIYVLPTPGPLGPAALAVAMIPPFVILAAVALAMVALWVAMLLLRAVLRRFRR
ncbi:MAG TPA: hypothetical protein VFE52_02765 [Devosia sp.]|nr:hypothetical protein [Devosia sp.]